MWEHLKQEQKEKYKTLITNFASLSEAFSQKAEAEMCIRDSSMPSSMIMSTTSNASQTQNTWKLQQM